MNHYISGQYRVNDNKGIEEESLDNLDLTEGTIMRYNDVVLPLASQVTCIWEDLF